MKYRTAGAAVLLAAALWGASLPAAKALMRSSGELALAGLFYVGGGLGLAAICALTPRRGEPLRRGDAGWLAAAVVAGGMLGPALLLMGVRRMPANEAGMLANTETLFTMLIAVAFFGDRLRGRDYGAIALLTAGAALVVGYQGASRSGALLIVAGAVMWAIDNNVTQRLSTRDPLLIAAIKGLVAGPANLALAAAVGEKIPGDARTLAICAGVGLVTVGLSLTLFIYGLRHLGASRTSGLFAAAPAFTVAICWALGTEAIRPFAVGGGALMIVGSILMLWKPVQSSVAGRPDASSPSSAGSSTFGPGSSGSGSGPNPS